MATSISYLEAIILLKTTKYVIFSCFVLHWLKTPVHSLSVYINRPADDTGELKLLQRLSLVLPFLPVHCITQI